MPYYCNTLFQKIAEEVFFLACPFMAQKVLKIRQQPHNSYCLSSFFT